MSFLLSSLYNVTANHSRPHIEKRTAIIAVLFVFTLCGCEWLAVTVEHTVCGLFVLFRDCFGSLFFYIFNYVISILSLWGD